MSDMSFENQSREETDSLSRMRKYFCHPQSVVLSHPAPFLWIKLLGKYWSGSCVVKRCVQSVAVNATIGVVLIYLTRVVFDDHQYRSGFSTMLPGTAPRRGPVSLRECDASKSRPYSLRYVINKELSFIRPGIQWDSNPAFESWSFLIRTWGDRSCSLHFSCIRATDGFGFSSHHVRPAHKHMCF